jgi:mono/diheme cytochrome c family protein
MQNATKNMLLPAFVGSAVLVIAFTLLAIVARSPYTHSNLNAGFDPSYTRTEQTLVGAPIPFTGGGLAVPRAGDPVELGHQLFVVDGCATCHGLDGRGGIVGPSIIGTKVEKLRTMTSIGPKGMPAYAAGALTDEDVAAINAYLYSISK